MLNVVCMYSSSGENASKKETDIEKWNRIKEQVEAAEDKCLLSNEAVKRLVESGPGIREILGDSNLSRFGNIYSEPSGGDGLSEKMMRFALFFLLLLF